MIANRMRITDAPLNEIFTFVVNATRSLKAMIRQLRRSNWFLLLVIAGGAVVAVVVIKLVALLAPAFDISFLRDVGNHCNSGCAGGFGGGAGGSGGPPPPSPPPEPPDPNPTPKPPVDRYHDYHFEPRWSFNPGESGDYKGMTHDEVHTRLCQELGIKWPGCNPDGTPSR